MTGSSGAVTAVRAVCTAAVLLVAAIILFYCALIGVWVYSSAGSPGVGPGDVLWSALGLGVVALMAVGAVLIQLRWANRAPNAGGVALRSLLSLAGPGAVVLVLALAVAV